VLGLSAIAVAWIVTRSPTAERAATEPIVMPTQSPETTNGDEPVLAPPERMTETSPTRLGDAKVSRGIGDGTGPGPIPSTASESEPPPPAPTPLKPRAPISGGVLNGRAISKPMPPYPAIAKAAHASGTVSVQVTIDESGKVISATPVSGHPLLQQSAVQAARQARFSPTLLSGQPVKVTGILTYNFVPQ
jgi:protein TonB